MADKYVGSIHLLRPTQRDTDSCHRISHQRILLRSIRTPVPTTTRPLLRRHTSSLLRHKVATITTVTRVRRLRTDIILHNNRTTALLPEDTINKDTLHNTRSKATTLLRVTMRRDLIEDMEEALQAVSVLASLLRWRSAVVRICVSFCFERSDYPRMREISST